MSKMWRCIGVMVLWVVTASGLLAEGLPAHLQEFLELSTSARLAIWEDLSPAVRFRIVTETYQAAVDGGTLTTKQQACLQKVIAARTVMPRTDTERQTQKQAIAAWEHDQKALFTSPRDRDLLSAFRLPQHKTKSK